MIRKTFKILAVGIVAGAIGSAALTAPAVAGGSFSVTYTPTDPQEAMAVQAGLLLYSIFAGGQANGSIAQYGNNNQAGVAQNGGGNFGVVHQEGDDHSATLEQNGAGNACGIFQFGKGATNNVVQNGGQTCLSVGFGW